jgi:PEGA domain
MLNTKSVFLIAGIVTSVSLAAPDAFAQHRGGAMGRAATRAAAPRGGVAPVVPRSFHPGGRIAPRIVTGYPYRPYYRSYYRPYYPYYRPGIHVGVYSGYYGSYGYGLPYDYPYNYTYFINHSPYYAPYRYGAPGYIAAVPGYSYGGLRIDGAPPEAQVYVDGYYAGIVNDFDGALQHANLRSGPHRVELRVPGQAPVTFDVNVAPGQTITYHAGIR